MKEKGKVLEFRLKGRQESKPHEGGTQDPGSLIPEKIAELRALVKKLQEEGKPFDEFLRRLEEEEEGDGDGDGEAG